MVLRAITAGRISGTGVITLSNPLFGGALISTDGTNAAVVTIRKSDVNGKTDGDIIFDVSTIIPGMAFAPLESGKYIYYSITGTNAAAMLYEWVHEKNF